MENKKKSLRGPIIAVAFLLAVFLVVRWVVVTQRGPGSTTVVEAQGMDMSAMKAPIGVFPVGTDFALVRTVGGTDTFPATVVALSDEDVVARVAGLVKTVNVYPGDRVTAGQLLATLQADELASGALAESLAAQAMDSNARGSEQMLSQQESAVKRAEFEVSSAQSAVEAARAELEAADAGVENSGEMVLESEAARKESLAQLTYAKLDYDREKKLYEAGAISRDALDQAKRNIDEAQARLDQADARVRQAQNELRAMRAKRTAAANMLKQAESQRDGAIASQAEAKSGVARAKEDLAATRSQAAAARANARSAGALSSYTQLHASDAGVVSERLVSPGTPVMPGQVVLKLKVDRQLRVQADLPQRLAASVTIGSGVRITINKATLDATVTSVFPFVEGSTRSFRVEAKIENAGRLIQPGSFAELEVVTSTPVSALSVARAAVKTAGDGSHYVWVVKEGDAKPAEDAIYTCTMHPQIRQKGPGLCPICKMDLVPLDATGNLSVEKRTVRVGVSDSRYTAVLDGLEEGEEVTYAGDQELFPGAAISVVKWGEDGPVEESDETPTEPPASPSGAGKASTMEGHERHIHGPQDKFTCPMHPEVHKPVEGACPICKMDLTPIEDGGN
ncbi:MAG: heavy metal-binding domain-containing protein [Fimbriimonadaceae bacterium]